MSGSHFNVQTSKLLLINATVVNLGQGHWKAIHYILQDQYIFGPKYLRFSSNGLTYEAKAVATVDAEAKNENIKAPQTGVTSLK